MWVEKPARRYTVAGSERWLFSAEPTPRTKSQHLKSTCPETDEEEGLWTTCLRAIQKWYMAVNSRLIHDQGGIFSMLLLSQPFAKTLTGDCRFPRYLKKVSRRHHTGFCSFRYRDSTIKGESGGTKKIPVRYDSIYWSIWEGVAALQGDEWEFSLA